jgi:serine/threonine protein kinase
MPPAQQLEDVQFRAAAELPPGLARQHQKGIIHRNINASNILATLHDDMHDSKELLSCIAAAQKKLNPAVEAKK